MVIELSKRAGLRMLNGIFEAETQECCKEVSSEKELLFAAVLNFIIGILDIA